MTDEWQPIETAPGNKKKTLKPKRCQYCEGDGYFRCSCWPADCICDVGDEECSECGGTGFECDEYPDYDDPRYE